MFSAKPTAVLTVIAIGAMLLGGCGTPSKGTKRTEGTVSQMEEVEKAGINVVARIDAVLADLEALETANDVSMVKLFDRYRSNLKKLESSVDDARQKAVNMRARADAHYKEWEKELASVPNPDVKARAEERRQQWEAAFERLNQEAQQARESFDPFLGDLKDIEVYLVNDLTAGGVNVIRDLIDQAKTDGQTVKAEINEVIDSIAKARASYSSRAVNPNEQPAN